MAKSMYAVVGTWILAEGRWEEQVQGLRAQTADLAHAGTLDPAGVAATYCY